MHRSPFSLSTVSRKAATAVRNSSKGVCWIRVIRYCLALTHACVTLSYVYVILSHVLYDDTNVLCYLIARLCYIITRVVR